MLALVPAAWSIENIIITILIIAAGVAILYIALRQFGIAIPPWLIQMFWIVVVLICAILAIRFIFSL